MKAAKLGDDEAILDALRASYAANTPAWSLALRDRVTMASLDRSSAAEANLILAQATTSVDPSVDALELLRDLREKFPNDELIEDAWDACVRRQ